MGTFELNSLKEANLLGLKFYVTPKRYHLNGVGSVSYQSALVDRTRETGGNLENPSKKTEIRAFFNCYLFKCFLKRKIL